MNELPDGQYQEAQLGESSRQRGRRKGSFLLLFHYPANEIVLERAREALADPSLLVRIAAASVLAYRGDRSGEHALIEGLGHERWEVRWWCGKVLAYVGGAGNREAIARRLFLEPDSWVKGEMAQMLESFE